MHDDFVIWEVDFPGKMDPNGICNSRKLLQALLQRAELSKDVEIQMLDDEGIVTMELAFKSGQADEATLRTANGPSGYAVTKAFAHAKAPVKVNDVYRVLATN